MNNPATQASAKDAPGLLPEVNPGTRPYGQLKWLAVDFDDTVATSLWTPENPTRKCGPPIWKNVGKIENAVLRGYKIIIHTARGWTDYEYIEWYLNHWSIPFSRIICGKVLAIAYIDDKAIPADAESWIPGEQ